MAYEQKYIIGQPYCTTEFANDKLTITPSINNKAYSVVVYTADGKRFKTVCNCVSATSFTLGSGIYYVETKADGVIDKSVVTAF